MMQPEQQSHTALWVNTQGSTPPKAVAPQNLTISIPTPVAPVSPPVSPTSGDFAQRAPVRGSVVPTNDPFAFRLELLEAPTTDEFNNPIAIDVSFGDWDFLINTSTPSAGAENYDSANFWATMTGSGQLDLPATQVNYASLLHELGSEGANGLVSSDEHFDFSVLNQANYEGSVENTMGSSLGLDTGVPSSDTESAYATAPAPEPSPKSHQPRGAYVPPAGAANTSSRRVGGAWSRPPPPSYFQEEPSNDQQSQEYQQHRRASSPAMSIPGLGRRRS
jgi:hypothetical protein